MGATHYKALFDALTVAQRDVMGQLAIDNAAALKNKPVVRQLVDLGLIATWTEDKPLPGTPVVTVKLDRFAMPLAVHVAWCAWCAEHLTPEESAEVER